MSYCHFVQYIDQIIYLFFFISEKKSIFLLGLSKYFIMEITQDGYLVLVNEIPVTFVI